MFLWERNTSEARLRSERHKMFTHLHVHTEMSPLDGLAKIEELILKAQSFGQSSMAITDHGSTSGLFEAYNLGIKHNFKMLLGSEFYFENIEGDRKSGHLILIAKDNIGLANLYRLQKAAYDNFYYKPRINLEMLNKYHEGLICTTACMANQICQYILKGEIVMAKSHLQELNAIFKEDFYVEIQSSTLADQHIVNKKLIELSTEIGYKLIVTNDVHYVNKEDSMTHEVLLCIQQKTKMDNAKRWKFETQDYWLKDESNIFEPIEYVEQNIREQCLFNIQEIVDKCDVSIDEEDHLPHYQGMSKEEEDAKLLELTYEKYQTRIKSRGEENQDFIKDVMHELDVIKQTGYSGYFLIVQEYINWAKSQGILVGDGRGSGAGSKTAYTLGMSEINPQKHNLLFERFLTLEREPDWDADFSDIEAVFKHLQDVYGLSNVARVGAFNRFTCKSATRKCMGVYNYSQRDISAVVALMPNKLSFTLEEAIEESAELKKWFKTNQHIYVPVKGLENTMSHFSTHAGGVIICNDLVSKLPVTTDSDDRSKLIIALDKKQLEKLRHYKFDILGLNSLITLQNALEFSPEIDWSKIDYDDAKVYDMLCTGDVLGVFQLSEQSHAVIEQQPRNFEDLIALNSIIRPGVADFNDYISRRRSGKYVKNEKTPYMDSSYGLIVYQEQYLLLANTYAGWDIGYADNNIRKNKDILNDHGLHDKFLKDAVENGNNVNEMHELWLTICNIIAGKYSFNRSHACSYAKLSFQTAYMKCYHPQAFYASLMTANYDDKAELSNIMAQIKSLNIKILSPDINESSDRFVPTIDGIRYRLDAINCIGTSVLQEIEKLKPITSLEDFLERRTPKIIKSNAVINLIKAGSFDFDSKDRHELLTKFTSNESKKENSAYERESLGMYITESPFDKYPNKELSTYTEGQPIAIVCEITEIREIYDKRHNLMSFATASNQFGNTKLVFFSSVWKTCKVKIGQFVLISGTKSKDSILVSAVEEIEV